MSSQPSLAYEPGSDMTDRLPWTSKIVTIPAPADRVLALLTDLDGGRGWLPRCATLEGTSAGPFARGTQWREARRIAGIEVRRRMTVDAHTSSGFLASGPVDNGPVYSLRYSVHAQSAGSCSVMASLQPHTGATGGRRGLQRLRPWFLRPEQIFCWLLRSDLIALAQAATTTAEQEHRR